MWENNTVVYVIVIIIMWFLSLQKTNIIDEMQNDLDSVCYSYKDELEKDHDSCWNYYEPIEPYERY